MYALCDLLLVYRLVSLVFNKMRIVFIVVVARIYHPVTGQRQTLAVGRSTYFSLH